MITNYSEFQEIEQIESIKHSFTSGQYKHSSGIPCELKVHSEGYVNNPETYSIEFVCLEKSKRAFYPYQDLLSREL